MRVTLLKGFQKGFRLETARLVLRDFRPGDELTWQVDPRYLRHYLARPDSQAIVGQARLWARETPRTSYQLGVQRDGELIGCVGVRCEADWAEVGGEIDPTHWRQGFCSEAMVALTDFARRELGVTRFVAKTRNPAMEQLCRRKLGMHVVSVTGGETTLEGG